ncbi:hypothetical protein [Prosthecobacter sp.]|uniref:hypothetical protein n=1 Tax=Prosthecobacter sp. TaxID=1965333 RepID=UPI0024892575|nr:hypothetical protein [Prosthecobacter sp.]MDI1314865.1 hypothetical protein [Prosthecobacter sp.]
MNDDEIDSLIRRTHPKPDLPAAFNREVWERISIAGQDSLGAKWREFADALFLWVAKPVPAIAVVTVMLAAGAGLGGLTVSESSASAQRTAYFASINPLHPGHLAEQE